VYSQIESEADAFNFLKSYCNEDELLSSYFYPAELEFAKRLGIEYIGVKNKYLIGSEVPDFLEGSENFKDFNVEIKNERNNYGKLLIKNSSLNIDKVFYLKDGKIISPVLYHTRDWLTIDSKYIRFFTNSREKINNYAIDKLNNFVEELCRKLEIEDIDVKVLESKKILYFLCMDLDEIEKLTGYRTMGMCNLAFDYVISIFNSHYHELAHILINFKLKRTFLYTHPFFQEGFAVSAGGRGGLSSDVMLRTGVYLSNNFPELNEHLFIDNFYKEDASISYPVSGLFNSYFISRSGMRKYLDCYIQYCYQPENPNSFVRSDYFADSSDFLFFKDSISSVKLLQPLNQNDKEISALKFEQYDNTKNIYLLDSFFIFRVPSDFVIHTTNYIPDGYISNKYYEKISNIKYLGSKYLIIINENEISVYNLFTDLLLVNYSSGFEPGNLKINKFNGFYLFMVRRTIFEEDITEMEVIIL